MLVGVVHVAVVGRYYFVGSFDDDAGYILGAKALVAGQGLSGHMASGTVVAGPYPPGFPALLAPLLWAFPHTYVPLRVLSVVCYAALFPLTWLWLGRKHVSDAVRLGTLVLLALNPVAATFGSMVMAEMPFLVVVLVVLLALDRWEDDARVLCASGVVVVLGAAGLVWLKEAGAGLVAGLVLWLLLRRKWGKGLAVAVTVGVSLVPVVVARLSSGVPLAGSRYSQELGAYYKGSLADRLIHVFPAALHLYGSVALPASVVPRGAPMPLAGWGAHLLRFVAWQVTVCVMLGVVVWVRRHRDGLVVIVGVYVAETLLWPYVNERRVILVLPIMLAWYALGVRTVLVAALGLARRAWRERVAIMAVQGALGTLTAAVVGVPLVAQFSRDYLFGDFQRSSHPQGSRYMALLARAPGPTAVIETDYLSTTALFSEHRTAESAFIDNNPLAPVLYCQIPSLVLSEMTADDAGWLLTGSLNKPDTVDNPCLLSKATTQPWSVRLLRTATDGASVFELIGPGTVHPDLRDLVAAATLSGSHGSLGSWDLASQGEGDNPGTAPWTVAAGGAGTLTWSWGATSPVQQVSVGGARSLDSATGPVTVQLHEGGTWVTVASAPTGVGEEKGQAPFLFVRMPAGTVASGLRVVIHGQGRLSAVDVHALGPIPARP